MLEICDISVSYGAITALRRVNMTARDHEIVCVLGANGAGKSTLIRAISGQVPVEFGSIRYDGRELSRTSPMQIARLGIIQCPEGRQLFEDLSVGENLKLGAARLRLPWKKLQDDLDFIVELFPVISERWGQRALTLSGGEQQMVALARSVIARPRLLLLDEPSLGLAPKLVKQVFDRIPRIAEHGASIVLIEQNARAALKVAHRGYVLRTGEIVREGRREEIQHFLEKEGGYFGETPHL